MQENKLSLHEFGIDLAFEIGEEAGSVVHNELGKDEHELKLVLPTKFKSGPRSTDTSPLSGEISFNINLQTKKNENGHWRFKLNVPK